MNKQKDKCRIIAGNLEKITGNCYDPGTIYVTVIVERQSDTLVVTDISYEKMLAAGQEQYFDDNAEARDLTFINYQNPGTHSSSVTVELEMQKSLTGKTLANGEFSFKAELIDSVPSIDMADMTAVNDANGRILFPGITFDQEGTYIFRLSETAGTDPSIDYDETVWSCQNRRHRNVTIGTDMDDAISLNGICRNHLSKT